MNMQFGASAIYVPFLVFKKLRKVLA